MISLSFMVFSQDIEADCEYKPAPSQEKRQALVFMVVDNMPIFKKECESEISEDDIRKCSSNAIQKYMRTLRLPENKSTKNKSGKVYVSFIVEKDGMVSSVTLLRGFDKYFDELALEHIRKMPKFYTGGFHKGKPERVKFQIPIVFQL